MKVAVGGTVSVTVGKRGVVNVSEGIAVGSGVRVGGGTGVFVFSGNRGAVESGVGVCVVVGMGAGANILFATGCPNTPVTTAVTVSAKDTISHCQPVTMRA